MSRKSVRNAVAAYFAPPVIPGLNTVFRAPVREVEGQQFFTGQGGDQSGAVAYVAVAYETDHRMSVPRVTGIKRATYRVALSILFRSTLVDTKDGDSDPLEAVQDACDDIIDAIKARLRADATLGGTVFSAGEGGERGADDIEITSFLPRLIGNTTMQWTVLYFVVTEIITA